MSKIANCGGLVIDDVTIKDIDGVLTAIGGGTVANATTTSAGVVKQSTAVAEATGNTVTDVEFKALLDALKTAGIMATK